MTRERLYELSDENLFELARRLGIKNPKDIETEELIELIFEAKEEEREEQKNANNLAMKIKKKKYDIVLNEEIISQITTEYPLPERYNETQIVLMLRDPAWAFTYWDLGGADHNRIQSTENETELFLRVYHFPEGQISEKSYSAFFDIPLRLDDESWYINLPFPGLRYCIDLMIKEYAKDVILCRSNLIKAPRADVAKELKEGKTPLLDALYLSGLFDPEAEADLDKNPQRIISLLDSQYLHLTN